MWNLMIALDLKADGNGSLDYAGSDEGMICYRDPENGGYFYGTGAEEAADMPLPFTEEGDLPGCCSERMRYFQPEGR